MSDSEDMTEFGSIVERITKGEVPIRNIERELICPICKELFTHPLILPCQHSVCHKCVKELLLINHEDSISTDAGSESSNPGSPRSRVPSPSMERLDRLVRSASLRRSFGKRGSTASPGWRRSSLSVTPRITTFPCPGCQHDIDLGERGISMLFRNFTLESIVERYRQAARAAVAIMCSACKPPAQEATKSCMDCKASYCNECFKMNHPWGTPKAQHEYVGPTLNFRPKVLMCPEHEMEKVNMYCEVCRRPVCHLCKLGGSHANHKVTSMSNAYKILKEKLSKSIHYLISKEDQVRAQISALDVLINQTEDNGELAERQVNEHFERLFSILQDRRAEMLQSITQSKTQRVEKLRAQVEEYQGMLENSGLVGYAQEVLKETDQSCFVQTAKQLHTRIQKATESVKTFHPSADPTFTDFVLDVSKEESLLKELCFGNAVPQPPIIDRSQSCLYNKGLICWQLPGNSSPTDRQELEYRKVVAGERGEEAARWQSSEGVYGPSAVVSNLDNDSAYSFRVRTYRSGICGPFSPEVTFHTPPAPVFGFLFNEKCGFSPDRLVLSKPRDSVESVAGLPFLLAAERVQAGTYVSLDHIIGDTGISQGRHFWAFRVEASSYMVKVGVVSDSKLQDWFHSPRDTSSPRYDHDSGHDSGSEDASYEVSQPFMLLAVGMGRLFIPKAAGDPGNRMLAMPRRVGVCLDYEQSRVSFYDADTMRCLYERQVECSGIMYPAFGLMGGGAVHLDKLVADRRLKYPMADH
ncbi:E3 ubiquitin-protein ligase TRIM36 isoform X3 [Paramormyrops kingsleyae]|uniref:Tripartite motif containing 36 n=1 Tax=Paramormyrops kingsleyae TaxID=1676925 RepID=A0A3B3TBS9_9TELE|nr:E3 ubiquitin-protein ligase TRIM36 isoform X1 [Paramormyrops kingsleyae]